MPYASSFDIIVVGAGLASATVVAQILEELMERPLGRRCRVAVVEKQGEFWRGIPYGKRSSINSLLITSVRDFVPEPLKCEFLEWIGANKQVWIAKINSEGGSVGKSWLERNAVLLQEERWEEIYLPRFIFGEFLSDYMNKIIAHADAAKRACVELITGEVINLKRVEGHCFVASLQSPNSVCRKIHSDLVVLAIGSPPMVKLPRKVESSNSVFLDDVFGGGLDNNLETVRCALARCESAKNVLLIGSNASANELIYHIGQDTRTVNMIDQVVCISSSGSLPTIVPSDAPSKTGAFELLSQFTHCKNLTADELYRAITAEIEVAHQKNQLAWMIPQINAKAADLIDSLTIEQQKNFHDHYGMNLTRLVRRCGAEYGQAARDLLHAGKLKVILGKVTSITRSPVSDACLRIECSTAKSIGSWLLQMDFNIVINCGGFQVPDSYCSSPLIRNLVTRQISAPNSSGRGFAVNDDFEASDGLFIAGPLLNGIFNSRLKTWHIESAKRIFSANKELAQIIYSRLEAKSITHRPPVSVTTMQWPALGEERAKIMGIQQTY